MSTNGRGLTAPAERSLRLEIPPDARFSRAARERVTAFALAHEVGPHDAAEFVTAVSEAIANAIEHSRTPHAIELACSFEGGRITARIADDGIGFALETLREPRLPEPLAERGRGLPIMRQCSHFIAIDSAPGRGTVVTLGRTVAPRDADDRMLAS